MFNVSLKNVVGFILVKFPFIKKGLFVSQSSELPEDFVRKRLFSALWLTVFAVLGLFFVFFRGLPGNIFVSVFLGLFFYLVCYPFVFAFTLLSLRSKINARRIDIERDLLFHGRYVLIKINSGTPLYNAILESSKISKGPNPFKDISFMLNVGIPLENAVQKEAFFSPSDKLRGLMKKILFSLKTGADLSKILTIAFARLSKDELIKVKEYNKKMGSIIILYTVVGIVAPCLGIAILIMVSSVASFSLSWIVWGVVFFFIALIQVAFIFLVRSIRPKVNVW